MFMEAADAVSVSTVLSRLNDCSFVWGFSGCDLDRLWKIQNVWYKKHGQNEKSEMSVERNLD